MAAREKEVGETPTTNEPLADIGWNFWLAALRGEEMRIPASVVPLGYYRLWDRHRTKSWPVAVWFDEGLGKKAAQVGRSEPVVFADPGVEEDFSFKTFSWCCRNPITPEVYQDWIDTGQWPAAPEASQEIGANSNKSPEQVREELLDQVAAALNASEPFVKIETAEQATQAAGFLERLTELAGEADKIRAAEKKPHWDAGKAVDARWNPPIIEPAKIRVGQLKLAMDRFGFAQKQKAAAEAAQAEKEGRAGEAVTTAVVPIKGRKRAYKPKIVRSGSIVDQDKLYAGCRNTPAFVAKLQEFVNEVYGAGGNLPGCEAVEDVGAR